ncbi:autophagy-related protein 27 [Mycena alexandri]|uniref:Autophagy-related protein 27 n=1 Tax=Mycena alexandri TaxID=1745969 RepID=A0AAD6TKJ1_9AGAR|nr:autophagy-related protein 27 [Mycena alexandri]
MILRPLRNADLSLFLLLLSWSIPVAALEEPFENCHLKLANKWYDMEPLRGEHTVTQRRNTPPTREVYSARLSLCSDLEPEKDVPKGDQCPPGTRVCLTKINEKDGSDPRIVSVIPIAQTSTLNPTYTPRSSPNGVSLLLHGSNYPHPINATDAQQSVIITLLCDTSMGDLKFNSYNGEQLELEWSSPAGCEFAGEDEDQGNDGEKDSPKNGESSSGSLSSVGWFLLLLLLAFAVYMGMGMYINYTTYAARGVDLIPHRDFWMEVPYMLRDVLSHLCSAVRPRRSSNRGGYIAV